jgi:hypothetical protein
MRHDNGLIKHLSSLGSTEKQNMYTLNESVGTALLQCYTQEECTGIEGASVAVDAGIASSSGSWSKSGSKGDDFDVPTVSTSRIGLGAA